MQTCRLWGVYEPNESLCSEELHSRPWPPPCCSDTSQLSFTKPVLCQLWESTQALFIYLLFNIYLFIWGFPGGSVVKNLPAMQEMQVQSLGLEDPPKKEMATHSSILPGESHGQRSLVGYSPWGRKTVGDNLVAKQQCIYLFALGLSCGTWDLSSSTRDQTQAPCIRSAES